MYYMPSYNVILSEAKNL